MPDARRYTKCAVCGDLIWFDSWDEPPQSVVCACGACQLTESEKIGPHENLNQEELDSITGAG